MNATNARLLEELADHLNPECRALIACRDEKACAAWCESLADAAHEAYNEGLDEAVYEIPARYSASGNPSLFTFHVEDRS